MGARGPVPDRTDNLARPRSRKGKEQNGTEVTKGTALPASIPDADPDWHPIARMLWDAMLESGQRDFYQSTDWALAYSLCEDLSQYKKPLVNKETGEEYYKRSGQMLQTIYSSMSDLLVTEGARRRVRIELEAPVPESKPASIVAIEGYKSQLGVAPDSPTQED